MTELENLANCFRGVIPGTRMAKLQRRLWLTGLKTTKTFSSHWAFMLSSSRCSKRSRDCGGGNRSVHLEQRVAIRSGGRYSPTCFWNSGELPAPKRDSEPLLLSSATNTPSLTAPSAEFNFLRVFGFAMEIPGQSFHPQTPAAHFQIIGKFSFRPDVPSCGRRIKMETRAIWEKIRLAPAISGVILESRPFGGRNMDYSPVLRVPVILTIIENRSIILVVIPEYGVRIHEARLFAAARLQGPVGCHQAQANACAGNVSGYFTADLEKT